MATGKFIAYYRVSTQKQGQSGLGLEAQQQAVISYLNGGDWELAEQFTEVETGKGADALNKRPQLKAAIDAAKKAKGYADYRQIRPVSTERSLCFWPTGKWR